VQDVTTVELIDFLLGGCHLEQGDIGVNQHGSVAHDYFSFG
jgi:hypothetical protein